MVTKEQIKIYMRNNLNDHVVTGVRLPDGNWHTDYRVEINITSLAEDAINHFTGDDYENWHEDGHIVWDCAAEIAWENGDIN